MPDQVGHDAAHTLALYAPAPGGSASARASGQRGRTFRPTSRLRLHPGWKRGLFSPRTHILKPPGWK